MKLAINREKLCKARVLCGLTINEAARKAGVSVATMSAVESGKTVPRPKTLIAICEAIECRPEEVLDVR